jgi:VanZ family protein
MMQPTKNLLAPKVLLLLAVLYSLIISIAFLVPGRAMPSTELPIDKFVHVSIHAGLFFIWALFIFRKQNNLIATKTFALVAIFCLFYGIIIEVLQEAFVELRRSDVMDLVANAAGTMLGAILFYKTRHYFENQN